MFKAIVTGDIHYRGTNPGKTGYFRKPYPQTLK